MVRDRRVAPQPKLSYVSQSQRHFLHVFSTFGPAGVELRTAGLMIGLGPGFRHTVISLSGRTDAAQVIGDKADLTLMDLPKTEGFAGNVRALRKVLRAENPDLLLTYNWGSMDAAFAAKSIGFKRHVHHEDGFNADEVPKLKSRRNWARRLALRNSSLVVPSQRLLGIAKNTWHLPKVRFISNGVDLERFAYNETVRQNFREQHGIPKEALVVGTMAQLRPVKRQDRLVRACALIDAKLVGDRPVYLAIVGEGDEGDRLKALAQDHKPPGGKVIFAGHMNDPAQAFPAFDLFAITSASEQQPVSILESMAASVPVVATDVGDIRKTVPDACHPYLVSIDQSEAEIEAGLAASFGQVLANEALRADLGRDCLGQASERYSFQVMLEAYREVFDEAMKAH